MDGCSWPPPAAAAATFSARCGSRTRPSCSAPTCAGGVATAQVYRPWAYRGVTYAVYQPSRYYRPAFYTWAYRPWRRPVYYSWGWSGQPWYGYYRGWCNPYPYYVSPVFWLTDLHDRHHPRGRLPGPPGQRRRQRPAPTACRRAHSGREAGHRRRGGSGNSSRSRTSSGLPPRGPCRRPAGRRPCSATTSPGSSWSIRAFRPTWTGRSCTSPRATWSSSRAPRRPEPPSPT